ncbi:MAG: hypothetical protein LBT39_05910 [Treponema sp.]|jgi:hypothetical protein|nr:hypothetical protein [Treponema sp.]
MKKDKALRWGIFCFLLIFGFALVGCARSDPKVLAKETYELGTQALQVIFKPTEVFKLAKKAATIRSKVSRLSPKDRAIYTEELTRLTTEGVENLVHSVTDTASAQNAQEAAAAFAEALKALGF